MSKNLGSSLIKSIKEALDEVSNGEIVNSINIRAIRGRLHLSQSEFAKRYHINIKTLKQWEQGARKPDTTSLAYLECIYKAPEQIYNILNDLNHR